jgi:hypothetical protein
LRKIATGGATIEHQNLNDLAICLIKRGEAWVGESWRAMQHCGGNLGEQALPDAKVAR